MHLFRLICLGDRLDLLAAGVPLCNLLEVIEEQPPPQSSKVLSSALHARAAYYCGDDDDEDSLDDEDGLGGGTYSRPQDVQVWLTSSPDSLAWLQVSSSVSYLATCNNGINCLDIMQDTANLDSRACRAAAELRNARAALCRALMKVQDLEQEGSNADQGLRRLLPSGLGTTLLMILFVS